MLIQSAIFARPSSSWSVVRWWILGTWSLLSPTSSLRMAVLSGRSRYVTCPMDNLERPDLDYSIIEACHEDKHVGVADKVIWDCNQRILGMSMSAQLQRQATWPFHTILGPFGVKLQDSFCIFLWLIAAGLWGLLSAEVDLRENAFSKFSAWASLIHMSIEGKESRCRMVSIYRRLTTSQLHLGKLQQIQIAPNGRLWYWRHLQILPSA